MRGSARWCSSPGRPASARPPWYSSSSPRCPPMSWSASASASSCAASVRLTCRCSAIRQACTSANGQWLVERLSELAPSWVLQLHGLVSPETADRLRSQSIGAIGDRMLRELLDALCSTVPASPVLVLTLEDLHWSDGSTSIFSMPWPPTGGGPAARHRHPSARRRSLLQPSDPRPRRRPAPPPARRADHPRRTRGRRGRRACGVSGRK